MASSSSTTWRCEYQVFLSFRGEDTRTTFTDHLYTALVNAGFHTFRDDDELERGEDIASELERAIRQSQLSIVIFSKDYASSRWCLDELVNILLQRRKNVGHILLPVFYHVEPSDVRNQTGTFAKAFDRHEKRFEADMDRVERWRDALREAADLAGMPLQNQANGHEAKFIQNIIKEVGRKLNRTVLSVDPHLIGTDDFVQTINYWLQDGDDIGIGTICGMGGIGKTTIAKVAYNQNFIKFEGSSFLANIREASKQPNGLVHLQKQLLSDILKGRKKIKIYNVDEGIIKIEKALCCKRVLLVLDDIDQLDQFHAIIGMRNWLYPGSKIIITTRHDRLLKAHDASQIFKVNELDEDESLKLFSWHAFGQDYPVEAYLPHSRSIVQHCGGLPLALQVLGSSLSGNSVDVWESATQKLEAIPDSKIFDILKISFNSLKDDHDKDLFLDISCFFVGRDTNYITMILDDCGFYTTVGIQNLVERCLVTIDYCNSLQMHQLIQDMGREIIRQESPRDPGERRRLCGHKDAFNVLRRKTGTKTIESLALNFRERNWEQQQSFECDAFARMHNLRLLSLNYVQLTGGYENFPKDIRWLCWHGFPLKSIPHNFSLENLVVLEMHHSCLTHLWKGTKWLENLKILDVSYSRHLIKTPDVSGFPWLERLMLKDCISLIEVHESIGCLDRLVCLNLKGCKNLGKLPQELGNLTSVQEINLSGCSKLELVKSESCSKLELVKSIMWSLLSKRPQHPEVNHFSKACLPHSLTKLNLANSNITAVPSDIGTTLIALRRLDLDENPICSLPESIRHLTMLKELYLDNCRCLQSLSEVPSSLKYVTAENCTSLEIIIPNWVKSPWWNLQGCSKLWEVEGILKLEPIEKMDTKISNSLRLFDIESLGSNNVKMYNRFNLGSDEYAIGVVLYEWGIASIFISGSQVPNWYSYKREGRYISFKVPLLPNQKIQGMNVCVVYYDYKTCDYYEDDDDYYCNDFDYDEYDYDDYDDDYDDDDYEKRSNCEGSYYWDRITFRNVTKGCLWDYSPFFHGNNQEMIWLSHWKFQGDELKGGDEVIVSIRSKRQVKRKIGVHLVYEEDEQLEELSESNMNFNISFTGKRIWFTSGGLTMV